jgi:hypothetical protein
MGSPRSQRQPLAEMTAGSKEEDLTTIWKTPPPIALSSTGN